MTAADTHTPVDLSEFYVAPFYQDGLHLRHTPCGAHIVTPGQIVTLYGLLTAACDHRCPQARP